MAIVLGQAVHQKPEETGRDGVAWGEARRDLFSGEACPARGGTQDSGQGLLEAALGRGNMVRAWRRVKANRGSAGVDGLSRDETAVYLQAYWREIRSSLLEGSYRPQPVKRVQIPKPGGGYRELGIPTVTDRLIQQALLQVLQCQIDPTFSDHSYGFRPGRSAHDAVRQARSYVREGYGVVVDVDLEKFFDQVNHDILMDRLSRRVKDKRVLRLIGRYLVAGLMDGGVVLERHQGTPQGGPLSPLLANVLLDEVDRELEARGHCFVRYADDCNVFVRSIRAGERVMAGMRRLFEGIRLRVNETKSMVARAYGRAFLSYALWAHREGARLRVSQKALRRFRQRVRWLTRRTRGRSVSQVIEQLRVYLLGWKGYFRLAQTPGLFRRLDEWIRHRLRCVQLKHWRRGKTMYRELKAMGASDPDAHRIAANSRRWWRNSRYRLNRVMPIAYFDRLGLPRLS